MKKNLLLLILFLVLIDTLTALSGIELYNQGRLYEAKEALEHAVQSHRAGVAEMAVLGMTYTRLGMYSKAEQILDEALARAPEDPRVLNALAMLEFSSGNYSAAFDWLDRTGKGGTNFPRSTQPLVETLINRAVHLYQEGNFDQAAGALEEARKLDPINPRVIAMLIQLHRQEGPSEGLIELYRDFVKLEPENAQAHAELGVLLEETGQSTAAEASFLQAELYGTDEPYPYLYLALRAAQREVPLSELRTRLHLAIGKAVRRISSLRLQAAGTFQQKKGELSAEELEALQKLTGRTEQPKQIVRDSLLLLRESYSRPSEYGQDLRRLTDWYPHSLELRSALGSFLEEQSRHEEALAHWREVISDFPTLAEAHAGMARSLNALDQNQAARVAYRRARDLDPENPGLYRGLYQLYAAEGRKQELLQLYADIYERERTNSTLIRSWAELEEDLGLTEQATVHRLRAAELEQRRENGQE
ncbi:tetratricopeptide repeat protein [Marispirochaeta aestuarii]|uniref:tetratricopeptide repeat protein n=1 Tax=Marispirochaeta aestuarii TaxID=1963862 RepID=UPI0029C98021|nr:tetratricopeptide repeat protein [Marispirochaeta aestuarii]